MKHSPSYRLSLADLGQRTPASFPRARLNLAQLHPTLTLRGKRVRKATELRELRLRFLMKLPAHIEAETVLRIARAAFGAELPARRQERRIVDELQVIPIARLEAAGAAWWALELPVTLGAFLAETRFDARQLNALAAQLKAIDGVLDAEADAPAINRVVPLQEKIPGCTVGRANAPQDNLWSQRLVHLLDDSDTRLIAQNGQGITIGMIDTGYTDHVELDLQTAFDLGASTSVIDNGGGLDPMASGTSHGTATGSLITSAQHPNDPNDRVIGISPGARVIAVRALDFVIVLPVGETDPLTGQLIETFLPSNIVGGLQKCLDAGCDVINMSFGGVVSQAVRDLLHEAYERDIILCAAAGNCVQVVVEPAARPEVIACAAVGLDPATGDPRPWPGSSHGPLIDISAPGENVYIADWDAGTQVVRPGEGTSFAAPHLSAAAALWLQKHGASALRNRYNGQSRLADVFRSVVRASATVPGGWNTNQYGAGILNLKALLDQPLPKQAGPKGEVATGAPCEVAMGLIDLFLSGDRLPVLSETVRVRADVATIEVRDDGEAWGGAEPYLVETFYRIDGRTAKAELVVDASTVAQDGVLNCTFSIQRRDQATSIVKIRQRGRHGNLGDVNIGALEYNASGPVTVNVPNRVGRWDTTVRPIPLRILVNLGDVIVGKDVVGVPGFIGALTLLLEEDFWSTEIVDTVKEALRTHTRRTMENLLRELSFSLSLSDLALDYPQIDAERLSLEIEDRVRQSVFANANWWDAFWAGVDSDDILIQDFTMVNVLQLGNPVPIAPPEENGDHGRWLLRGAISKR